MKNTSKPCCGKNHPKVNDYVGIVRTDHGWFDGNLCGVVTSVSHAKTGRVSYTILTEEEDLVFCPKTRDCFVTVK